MAFVPVEVFYSFADVDILLLEQLEKHLGVLRNEGIITTWHKRKIIAGGDWQVELDTYLNKATLILLLISPDFLASDYQYGVELQRAMQRHDDKEARVIPIMLRACDWESAPFYRLQAIPRNGKAITSWGNRDEAFAEIAKEIRFALEAMQPLALSIPSTTPPPKASEDKKHHIEKLKNVTPCKMRLFVSIVTLLVLALLLVSFIPSSICFSAFCHSSQQSPNHLLASNIGKVQDQNLSMTLRAVLSPSLVLSGDLKHSSNSSTTISAVSLAKNTSTYDKIIVDVRNLRHKGVDILIDYIALKLLSIPILPRPLKVWTPGVATTYIAYPYPVTYKGQTPNQLLYAKPPQDVILAPGEVDTLSIQVDVNSESISSVPDTSTLSSCEC